MAKAASRSTRSKPDPREAIVDALMNRAADEDFKSIRLEDIAADAGMTLSELRAVYSNTIPMLAGFFRRIDLAVLADGPADPESGARDRLFEILMRRFDALRPYKPAIARMARSASRDPAFAFMLRQFGATSHKWTLSAADVSSSGMLGKVRLNGVMLAYADAVRVWLQDDDPELERTMVALDKALRRGEQAMRMVHKACRFVPRFPDRKSKPEEAQAA